MTFQERKPGAKIEPVSDQLFQMIFLIEEESIDADVSLD
jgi:hypothetical protein